ncbi:MAG TPA: PAS domain S-box protein, partial [Methanocella sp.]|nr:PAS domain S-box protein [Methanocella sp.]
MAELAESRRRIAALEGEIGRHRDASVRFRDGVEFLDNVIDCIQDGVSILVRDLNIVRVNRAMDEWYPHMKPLDGKKCYHVYHGRAEPCEKCPSRRAIEQGTAQSEVVPFEGPGHELKGWLELFAYPLTDDRGTVTGVIEYVRDITDRKRAEESLQLMRYVIDQTQDEASLAGPDGRFVYVNDAKCRSLGYTREELLSMTIWDVDAEMTPEMWPAIWKDLKEKGFKKVEAEHRAKDGSTFPTEIWTDYLNFHGNEYVCAFVRDVSERKRAEAEVRKSNEKYRSLVEYVNDWVW